LLGIGLLETFAQGIAVGFAYEQGIRIHSCLNFFSFTINPLDFGCHPLKNKFLRDRDPSTSH